MAKYGSTKGYCDPEKLTFKAKLLLNGNGNIFKIQLL